MTHTPDSITVDGTEYVRADTFSAYDPGDYPDKVLIRTVTMIYVGRVIDETDHYIVLAEASWVADTGRWHNALRDGTLEEVEPYLDAVYVSRGAVVDITKWRHPLPTVQK